MDTDTKDDANQTELREELQDLENVVDESADDEAFSGQFAISSFGADYNVDSLVRRMTTKAFYKPEFQREFVWNQRQASRFIESLLMGLPVPGIFIYRLDNGKHLIIDGLQRLTTLEMFYKGLFKNRSFNLMDVRDPWKNKTYNTLDEAEKLRLDDSIIHTTVFKQDFPDKDYQSVYEVFERINTGGMKLSSQEIRVCVNYVENSENSLMTLLSKLNEDKNWRFIYGPRSLRLKDNELILRFLAFLLERSSYKRPFRGFLDGFAARHRVVTLEERSRFTTVFASTIASVKNALGRSAFRPENAMNAAVFDAVMVTLAERFEAGNQLDSDAIKRKYAELMKDEEFNDVFRRSTADEDRLQKRFHLAKKILGGK